MLFWSCWIDFCYVGEGFGERRGDDLCEMFRERRLYMMKLRGEGKDREEGGHLKERDGERSRYSGSG